MNARAQDLYVSTIPLIEVAGEANFMVTRDILDLLVSDHGTGPRQCRLRLSATGTGTVRNDSGLLYQDGRIFDFGKEIAVYLGPHDRQQQVFSGRISRIDAHIVQGRSAEVEIYAEDRLADLAMTRRTKTYERVTTGELVRRVASEHGFTAEVSIEGPRLDSVQQWNETDLSFLGSRLAMLGGDLWIEGRKLHAADSQDRKPNELKLHAGAELLSLVFAADLSGQRNSIAVGGYDAGSRRGVEELSRDQDMASITRGGRSGLDILKQTFGERRSARRLGAVTSADEARALAKAAHRVRTRRFATVRGAATILPAIAVGTRLTFDGVGEMFGGGGYAVTDVSHAFDRASGATTLFSAERATVGGGQ